MGLFWNSWPEARVSAGASRGEAAPGFWSGRRAEEEEEEGATEQTSAEVWKSAKIKSKFLFLFVVVFARTCLLSDPQTPVSLVRSRGVGGVHGAFRCPAVKARSGCCFSGCRFGLSQQLIGLPPLSLFPLRAKDLRAASAHWWWRSTRRSRRSGRAPTEWSSSAGTERRGRSWPSRSSWSPKMIRSSGRSRWGRSGCWR